MPSGSRPHARRRYANVKSAALALPSVSARAGSVVSNNVTVLFGSAVPMKTRVLSFVIRTRSWFHPDDRAGLGDGANGNLVRVVGDRAVQIGPGTSLPGLSISWAVVRAGRSASTAIMDDCFVMVGTGMFPMNPGCP